jgi:hypothetical protein
MDEAKHNNDVIHVAFKERCSKTRTRAIIFENESHQSFPTRPDVSIPVDGLSGHRFIVIGLRYSDLWETNHSAEVAVLPTTNR